MPTRLNEVSGTTWSCTICGHLDESVVGDLKDREKKVNNMLQSMSFKCMMPGGIANVQPEYALEIASTAAKTLSSMHYLTLKCQSELARVCASHAHVIDQAVQLGFLTPMSRTPVGSLVKVRSNAASAGLEYIRRCECIAAQCLLGKNCTVNHPAVYGCGITAFHAFQDLKNVPTKLWPARSDSLLRKYVPIGYIDFGRMDRDIQEMESFLYDITDKERDTEMTTGPVAAKSRHGRNQNRGKKSKKRTNKKGRS
jgi:hypothetical protein